ncbi:MAG TPA: PAS domain S-box protein [Anaerolineales bacterium]|nr:PAS domain S-box protein [Anaerolineales bacterium]
MDKEQKIRTSELLYCRLFEAAQDGSLILDAETGAITDVNPFPIKMLGYSREEFVEKKLWEVGAFRDNELRLIKARETKIRSAKDFWTKKKNEYPYRFVMSRILTQ